MSKIIRISSEELTSTHNRTIPTVAVVPPVSDEGSCRDASESLIEDVERLRAEAEGLVELARRDAEQIRAKAEQEAQRIAREAYDKSWSEGYDAGVRESRAALAEEIDRELSIAQAAVCSANEYRRRFVQACQDPLVDVSMTVVRKVLHRELQLQPSDIQAMVSEALECIEESTKVEVRVNQRDYDSALHARPVWSSVGYGTWDIVVIPDSAIEQGGFEIRFDGGRIDALLETKLDLLQSTLTEFLEGRRLTDDPGTISSSSA